jgi:hypothetical protein
MSIGTLTPFSRVLVKKVIVANLVKLPAVYETQRFITIRYEVLTAGIMNLTVVWGAGAEVA